MPVDRAALGTGSNRGRADAPPGRRHGRDDEVRVEAVGCFESAHLVTELAERAGQERGGDGHPVRPARRGAPATRDDVDAHQVPSVSQSTSPVNAPDALITKPVAVFASNHTDTPP